MRNFNQTIDRRLKLPLLGPCRDVSFRPRMKKKSAILASPFSFEFLQFPVPTQPLPNCGRRNDQQNDDGEADNKGEAIGKQDHS
jgi:hypothetical protein